MPNNDDDQVATLQELLREAVARKTANAAAREAEAKRVQAEVDRKLALAAKKKAAEKGKGRGKPRAVSTAGPSKVSRLVFIGGPVLMFHTDETETPSRRRGRG
jgi:hypothetical protein